MALSRKLGRRTYLLLGLGLAVGAYVLLAWGSYAAFTSQTPSGNDFYSRWAGTRALLEGKDPYSPEVTKEIQIGMLGRPAKGGEDQVAFAYPIYVSLFVFPFALFPYPKAQALWMATNIYLALAAIALIMTIIHWQRSPKRVLALSLLSLLLYPLSRSILLGQFSVLVLSLCCLSLWAIVRRRDILAGIALAFSTVKPQMVLILLVFLLLWALSRRRWTIVLGFTVAMLCLLLIPSFLLPSWIAEFVAGLGQYRTYTGLYTGDRTPVQILFDYISPANIATWLAIVASLILAGYVFYLWWKALRNEEGFNRALSWSILATVLIPPQSGTTTQVLLILPLLLWIRGRKEKPLLSALGLFLLLVLPWAVFVTTVVGDAEQPIMFLPLSLMCLGLFTKDARDAPLTLG